MVTGIERLLAFLKSPASYSHQPLSVRAIETHISWVFVASPFVFKVKKPINLGFADFTTLGKRHYFCQRELELNRRLCPDVYLDVVPIYRIADTFSFTGEGEIAEYALKMRELPNGWFLNELLAQGAVGEIEIERIASRLHEFYRGEKPGPEIEQWGHPEKLKISTDENFEQVKQFAGKTISAVALETIRHFTNRFYVANEMLFRQRIEQRRILDCHGDLRLDHVHLTPETVTVFDCIEFNDRFRFIDIANDVAFLAMDFDFERRADLAKLFLQDAARLFDDPGILDLANFYKCYRAMVRGKVESIQAIGRHAADPEQQGSRAARYFRLALRYATGGSDPLLLVVMGPVGTGKSTVARQLARELDWPVFSSDALRKNLAGLPLAQRTPAELRTRIYSDEMTTRTYDTLINVALLAAQQDGGAVVDATFSRRTRREAVRCECAKAGVRYRMIELNAPDEQVIARLRQRETSGDEISDARLEDMAALNAAYEPAVDVGDVIRISATLESSETIKNTMFRLAEDQARALTGK